MSHERDRRDQASETSSTSRSTAPSAGRSSLTASLPGSGASEPVQIVALTIPAERWDGGMGSPARHAQTQSWMNDAMRPDLAPVQQKAVVGGAEVETGVAPAPTVQAAAQHGISGGGGSMPFHEEISHSFGRHDISGIRAHTDGAAREGAGAMGAAAFATGNDVAFASAPDLHTAAHEAAHVVQQRGGVHLSGGVGAVGDAHERHADAVADKVVRGESAESLLDSYVGASGDTVIQRKLAGGLENQVKFADALKQNNPSQIPAFKLFQWATKAADTFSSIDEVLEAYDRELKEKGPQSPGSSPKVAAPRAMDVAPKQVVEPPKIPKKQAKQHTTVAKGASPLIINYVWLGRGQLDALARYNIYSWRALGHAVNVFSHHFEEGTKHNCGTLGLQDGDAEIFDMLEILDVDKSAEGAKNPKVALGDARSVLIRWLLSSQNPERWPVIDDKKSANHGKKDNKPSQDNRFNMIDLTKSYIGGTRQGIVLDTKVGPSTHLKDYEISIKEMFISYSRGGKAVRVENQSMGTMQESEDLRLQYATAFNNKVQINLSDADPDKKHYDLITGYHADGHAAANGLDTAVQGPTGEGSAAYPVTEPGNPGHGPFRVFKNAGHQTNQGNELSDDEKARRAKDIKFLSQDVFRDELRAEKSEGDPVFLEKAKAALGSMPET